MARSLASPPPCIKVKDSEKSLSIRSAIVSLGPRRRYMYGVHARNCEERRIGSSFSGKRYTIYDVTSFARSNVFSMFIPFLCSILYLPLPFFFFFIWIFYGYFFRSIREIWHLPIYLIDQKQVGKCNKLCAVRVSTGWLDRIDYRTIPVPIFPPINLKQSSLHCNKWPSGFTYPRSGQPKYHCNLQRVNKIIVVLVRLSANKNFITRTIGRYLRGRVI